MLMRAPHDRRCFDRSGDYTRRMNRFQSLALLLALPLFTSCARSEASGNAAGSPVATTGAGEWRVWRGDAGMTGVSTASLNFPLKLAWTANLAKPIKATAVSDGKRVYIGDGKGVFRALNLQDGKEVWKFDTKDIIEGSALLHGEMVIFGAGDGNLYALNAADGKELWKKTTDAEIHCGPNVLERSGQPPLILVGSYDAKVYALTPDGKDVWQVETGDRVNGSVAVLDGNAMFGGCDGFLYFVDAAGKETGKLEVKNPIASTAAARNGMVVLGHYGNEIVAADAVKREPKWVYSDRDFPFFSSPAFTADGLVFAGDRGKRLHCLNAADGTEKWAFRTQGRVDSSPVVTGGNVVFGSDDGRVYAVKIADGTEAWQYEIGQPVQSSPCIAAGRLIIGADDGGVYCFAAE